jgi:hypothetical protein
MRCPRHGSLSQRRRGVHGARTPTVPWSPCPRPASASACPASTRPGSDVRCCPASAVRSTRPVSGVWCPVSGVRCRRPASVLLVSVSTLSAPTSWCSAWCSGQRPGSDRSDRRGPTVSATGARPSPQEPRWRWLGGLPGRWGAAGRVPGSPVGRQARAVAHRWPAARRSAGACGRPRSGWWVARAGMPLGREREGVRPHRGPGRQQSPRSRQIGRGNPV